MGVETTGAGRCGFWPLDLTNALHLRLGRKIEAAGSETPGGITFFNHFPRGTVQS